MGAVHHAASNGKGSTELRITLSRDDWSVGSRLRCREEASFGLAFPVPHCFPPARSLLATPDAPTHATRDKGRGQPALWKFEFRPLCVCACRCRLNQLAPLPEHETGKQAQQRPRVRSTFSTPGRGHRESALLLFPVASRRRRALSPDAQPRRGSTLIFGLIRTQPTATSPLLCIRGPPTPSTIISSSSFFSATIPSVRRTHPSCTLHHARSTDASRPARCASVQPHHPSSGTANTPIEANATHRIEPTTVSFCKLS